MGKLLHFPRSAGHDRRAAPLASLKREAVDRLPLAERLSLQFAQLTERLEDLSETARLVDQMGARLPSGPFKDDFELFRLDVILRIRGAKAELDEIAASCLAIANGYIEDQT